MKIVFVNRFFHPDVSATSQMLSDLAFALADEGRSVVVISSRHGYTDRLQRFLSREHIGGVDIYRVWTCGFGRTKLVGRALDYVSFLLSSSLRLMLVVRPGDIVVAKTDPPVLSALAYLVCALRGAKLVNWLQDLFPEAATTLKVGRSKASKLALALLGRLRDLSLRRARANVVIGCHMAQRVERLGVGSSQIVVVPNWANGRLIYPVAHEDNQLRRNWGLQDEFVVAYSGNLGMAHDYQTFLRAIIKLEQERQAANEHTWHFGRVYHLKGGTALAATPLEESQFIPVRWLFIGGGANYEKLRREAAQRKLTSVLFRGYQSRDALAESLSCADVHLATLRPEMEGLSVPSKVYGALASARPVVFVGDLDGEISAMIRRCGCGISVQEGNGAELARVLSELADDAALREQMGRQSRRVFEEEFELRRAVKRWQALLDSVAAEL